MKDNLSKKALNAHFKDIEEKPNRFFNDPEQFNKIFSQDLDLFMSMMVVMASVPNVSRC